MQVQYISVKYSIWIRYLRAGLDTIRFKKKPNMYLIIFYPNSVFPPSCKDPSVTHEMNNT